MNNPKKGKLTSGSTYQFSASVSASDPSGRYFSATGTVVVAPGAVELSAGFEQYVVRPGESASLLVEATDRATGSPLTAGEVVVEYGYAEWRDAKFELVEKKRVTAKIGPDGTATIKLKLDRGGSIDATISVADSKGRVTVSRGPRREDV